MAKVQKNQSLLISADDVKGIYSVSDFLNHMPHQLSCLDNKSSFHLKIFCSQEHQNVLKRNGIGSIREKIKSALEILDFFHSPILVQFWAPKRVGSELFLESLDLPFGINILRKGLCRYRRQFFNYKYGLDGEISEENHGPVGRVFRNQFPEFSPDVSCYSAKEYELRDFAISCGLHGYLALPVFDSVGQHCVGVLELITTWDGSYYLTDKIGKVDEALKAVGLGSSNMHLQFDMERESHHELALSEIKKILQAVCYTHKLPLAQTWFTSNGKSCSESVMCTSEKGSYMLVKKASSFQKDCIQLCLKKGQSVVWKAYTSRSSCFCTDIKQLSITEYSFVTSARKVDLTCCFAICLQNACNGNDIYVLEMFLPSSGIKYIKPQAFLKSVLAIVKEHSQNLRVASKQELGSELPVETIELLAENVYDSFRIHAFSGSPDVPLISNFEDEAAKLVDSVNRKGNFPSKEGKTIEFKVLKENQLEDPADKFDVSPSKPKDVLANHGIKQWSHKRKADSSQEEYSECVQGPENCNKELSQIEQSHLVLPPTVGVSSAVQASPQSTAIQSESSITIKASYEENMIEFPLSLSSGIRDFENEVTKRLPSQAGNFKIKYQNEENNWIALTSDADWKNFMRAMTSLQKTTVELLLEQVKIQHFERCTKPAAYPKTEAMLLKNESTITVKVTYKDDMLKFQLSLSAGLTELKDEVTKRLPMNIDNFEFKYPGEENSQITIASDSHLQTYMSNMWSQEKTTIRLSLEPITN